jgi:hypothetical protein
MSQSLLLLLLLLLPQALVCEAASVAASCAAFSC